MKKWKQTICFLVLFLIMVIMVQSLQAAGVEYKPDRIKAFNEVKKLYDDPNPILKNYGYKQIMTPEDYAKITYDMEAMKKEWAEVVGFRAPDEVGKIAPEIKPGKYGYKDKEKYPGLRELMIPGQYERFSPNKRPLALNFTEIEVVPTRQLYYSLPIAKATVKNLGKVKLKDGYVIHESYDSGFPFPKPSGQFRVQEILANWTYRYSHPEQSYGIQYNVMFDRNYRVNFESTVNFWLLKTCGRTIPPVGYYDARAKARGELFNLAYNYLSPRDQAGNIIWVLNRGKIEEINQLMIWLGQIRRVRKISGTDAQDTAPGTNTIFDDWDMFNQKLSPTMFPYKYELIAEREFLCPLYSTDGTEYVSKETLECKNVKMERRPMYVLQLTQLDPKYVYAKRIFYIDKETFLLHKADNYDQKGRLFRGGDITYAFLPEAGMFALFRWENWNFIDPQSQYSLTHEIPALWLTRENFNLGELEQKGK